MQRYDLIIVGGGLVGAGLAIALKQSGLRIALVDARLPDNADPRLFALNSASCQLLKNLEAWPALAPHATPIHQVHVSWQGHFGAVRLRREEVALPELGQVVPAYHIETVLNDMLQSLPNVSLYRPATLQSLQQQQGEAQLTLSTPDGDVLLHSPLVIGADGTQSTVRAQLRIEPEIFDYKQSALVTRTTLSRSHRHIAYERFNEQGAIAMLPLPGNECATIWTADNQTIAELMAHSDAAFLQTLQSEFGYRLGRLQQISQRHVFPLRMVQAKKPVDECVFLLGNAAHTLHPIAAQGFNLALYEVATLVESILYTKNQETLFTAADLQSISDQTQQQQAASIGLSHRLARLFSSQSSLLGVALPLGMMGLDIATPVKKQFIKKMMGTTGRVPRLLMDMDE